MKNYLFGYGSLINLESASQTLKRSLKKNDVFISKLSCFQRNWLLWDNVFSENLQKEVKGVFLNISYSENNYLNGIIFEVSNEELEYFKFREKNYNCVDVTNLVEIGHFPLTEEIKIFTFIGKKENLLDNNTENVYIFDKYIDIVNSGVLQFGEKFKQEFDKTTILNNITKISGIYKFIDKNQQKAR